MTLKDWNTCTDPAALVSWLEGTRRLSLRKGRLFMAAVYRWSTFCDEDHEQRIRRAECLADRLPGGKERGEERAEMQDALEAYLVEELGEYEGEREFKCDVLRDLFGQLPFRPMTLRHAWLTPTVLRLAERAYDQRHLPAGTLDTGRLSLLADALEEAGCDNGEVLAHLRGPGPHVLGCWAVDAVLGRP